MSISKIFQFYSTQVFKADHFRLDVRRMDDTAKRGGQLTSEFFTVTLCGPTFVVS